MIYARSIMDKFSESMDLEALRVIDAKIAEMTERTPTTKTTEKPRRTVRMRRSKTVNVSSSFASDAEVIDDSPVNCERMTSLREIREKIQRNQTLRTAVKRVSLKRNKSDSLIERSANYYDHQEKEEALDDTVEQVRISPELLLNDPESMDFSRLKSLLGRVEGGISPAGSRLNNDTDNKRMMDLSEFSIVKSLGGKESQTAPSPITTREDAPPLPTLKRQRSEDVPQLMTMMRFNSDTPPLSSQEAMNLPIIHSQDLDLIDTNQLESTAKTMGPEFLQHIDEDDGLEFSRQPEEENLDHENITFTKHNTMEMFHLEADRRGGVTGGAAAAAACLQDTFNQSSFSQALHHSVGISGHKYSQRTETVHRSALDESLNLRLIASWNLPSQIEREYRKKGIVEMFEWQVKCLNNPRVLLENKNLVYSAPTSAGKTLVSEILMIKSVLERRKKALLILPFVSVVREKMFYLQDLLTSSGIRVDGFFGGYSPPGGFESTQLAVCTIEKANSIVNKLLEQNKLDSLGIIVVDEIHLIGDPNRGYILELLLAKVLYMTRKHPEAVHIQIVAMSATLPKLELLCEWLHADMFVTEFRPVALNEMIKVDRALFNSKMELIRTLEVDKNNFSNDQDHIAQLCLETISEQCSVIVFCPTKDRCEKLALTVAEAIYHILKKDTDLAARVKEAIVPEKLSEVKAQMRANCPTGLDEVLSKTIGYGCAFHHASLTMEERDIVETSFRSGALKLIAATSTLSSGVNLPARRVIIRTPMFGGKVMNSLVYKQMIGRAGRTGRDTVGESILVCTEQNRKCGEELAMAKMLNPVSSCLVTREGEAVEYNMNNMKRAVLEVIAAGGATTNGDLQMFVHSTLFYVEHKDLFETPDFEAVARQRVVTKGMGRYPGQVAEDTEENALLGAIKFLIEYEFVRVQVNKVQQEGGGGEVHFLATRLGLACLSASLPPADGFLLFSELQRSRQCFVLESDLHAIYLVTPYSVCNQMNDIDWLLFLEMWERLPTALQRVGELVGIKDSFIVRAMRGIKKVDYKLMQIHKRFFIALALQELVNEMSIAEVAIRFKLSRGILQSLQQMAGTFAGIVTAFCRSLSWSMLELIVSQFKERLFFGIHPDLMDLMRIPSLNTQRARALHKSGIETLLELAQASAFVIEKVLYDQAEFQSEKRRDGEEEFETDERNKIRTFFVTGRMGLTVKEGADLVIKEAQDFLEMELGLKSVKWRSQGTVAVAAITEAKDDDVQQKAPLKRHSTEELLDDMLGEAKRTKSGGGVEEGSFGAKFSTDLFDLECHEQDRVECVQLEVKAIRPTIRKAVSESASESTDEDEIEELRMINRSHLMNVQKFEIDPPVHITEISIIDVCGDEGLFNGLKKLIVEAKDGLEIGLSIGVECDAEATAAVRKEPEVLIGGHAMLRKSDFAADQKRDTHLEIDEKQRLSGISVSLSNSVGVVFYLNLRSSTAVSWSLKVEFLCTLFLQRKLKIACYNLKEQLRILLKVIPGLVVGSEVKFADPKIANWLMMAMSSDHYLNEFQEMAKMYTPEYTDLLDVLCYSEANELYATGLAAGDNSVPVAKRTAVEAVLVQRILKYQETSMDPELSAKVFRAFEEVEMPMQVVLAVMECTGIRIHRDRCEELVDLMKGEAVKLERKIYALYGKKFNLRSGKELKRVMGVVRGSKLSVKEALEGKDTALHRLIRQHRKVGGVLNKMVYPMARNILVGDLIACQNMYYTATGRINMADPSIQTMAKDFDIESDVQPVRISLRSLFEPRAADVPSCFVSADFCQLELRILAHFSEDRALVKILKSSQDVFQAIAAKWNNIPEAQVTEELRNDTKQMCYGMIYGMGVRSLAAALRVDALTAQQRIDEFHRTYPGIRRFIDKALASVAQTGYVETLNGRRRYFPYLQERADEELHDQRSEAAQQAQYQRQAVNTMIQGSAADILKMAILRVEQAVRKRKVPSLRINTEVPVSSSTASGGGGCCAVMVLHLHDELMYEVPVDKSKAFGKLLRQCMESAGQLRVPLRVKVKSGPNWGELQEVP